MFQELSFWHWNVWQWLAVFQHEMLLFAGVFFLIGAIDDLAVDCAWLWLRLTGRAKTKEIKRRDVQLRELNGGVAVFIPAWQESEVIEHTVAHLLSVWPSQNLRLYLGVYRNDSATVEAAMRAAPADSRLRIVIHDRDGPSTKADCLNRLYLALRDDERRMGRLFASVVFHDAEDLVDPAGLGLLNEAIATGSDFAQLPVEPLPQSGTDWLGSHYCEEFAEAHGKAMVVRGALNTALPAAGVGCAISRDALQKLCRRRSDLKPFDPVSLTEDYELGLSIADEGGVCRFVRARGEDDLLVATRSYFPSRLDQIVRQKARWVHGISLQGWDRLGWAGKPAEKWMRARDRRGPIAALILLLGYSLLALTMFISVAVAFGWAEATPISPMLKLLLLANLAFFIWRAVFRFAFTARTYGLTEGLLAVLRIPVANVVAIMSGWRAVSAYFGTLLGRGIVWDKTTHSQHPLNSSASDVPAHVQTKAITA